MLQTVKNRDNSNTFILCFKNQNPNHFKSNFIKNYVILNSLRHRLS